MPTPDWQPLALRLGLEPIGPIPRDLPDAWLMRLEAMAASLDAAASDACYRMVLGEEGEGEATFRRIARAWLFTDELEAALKEHLTREDSPRRRWLEVLHRHCLLSRIEADPEIAGLTEELEQAAWRFYTTPPDALPTSERERARALGLRPVPMARANQPRLVRLFNRRNELARAEGLANYYELAMVLHEAPCAWLDPLLARLKAATDEPARSCIAWLNARESQPIATHWELRAAERAHALVPGERLVEVDRAQLRSVDAALGLPALGIPHHLVIRPLGVGGSCNVIDARTDVRLAVDTSRPRHTQLSILLHEYGHALHLTVASREALPFHLRALRYGEPAPVAEAMATVLESVKLEPAWLASVSDGTPDELAKWAETTRLVELLAVRYHMMVAAFDRQAYLDPEQDLDRLFLKLQHDYLGLQPPPEAGCLWAANPMVISAPCYQVSYVLANLAAYQLREALGGSLWGNTQVGTFLADHFWKPAGSLPWRERVERATGRPLDAEALLQALAN